MIKLGLCLFFPLNNYNKLSVHSLCTALPFRSTQTKNRHVLYESLLLFVCLFVRTVSWFSLILLLLFATSHVQPLHPLSLLFCYVFTPTQSVRQFLGFRSFQRSFLLCTNCLFFFHATLFLSHKKSAVVHPRFCSSSLGRALKEMAVVVMFCLCYI